MRENAVAILCAEPPSTWATPIHVNWSVLLPKTTFLIGLTGLPGGIYSKSPTIKSQA